MRVLTVLVLFIALSLYTVPALAQGLGRGTFSEPVVSWPKARVDTMGLNAEALAAHLDVCRQSGSSGCLVAYRGYIVQEWYDATYAPFIDTRSAVKSWTGLLAGILVADGRIALDDPVSKYIPEWKAGAEAGVTVRHLLTMTAGLRSRTRDDDPHPGVVGVRNTTGYVYDLPLDWKPGERWDYSNESVQLLSPILERAAGMPLSRYARERLFDPLRMDSTAFLVDEYYNTVTFGGAHTSLHDFAKIGQLMLNGGRWNGKQILPAEWVRQSTQPIGQVSNYGLLWWIDPPRKNYAATGTFDNNCIVFPDLQLVVARLQRDPRPDATVAYQSVQTLELLRRIVEGGPSVVASPEGKLAQTSAWEGFADLKESADVMPLPEGGIAAFQQAIGGALGRQACEEGGRAIVALVIDEKGKVVATRIEEGTPDVCSSAVETALREIRFSPGLVAGKPVKVLLRLPIQRAK